MLHTFLGKLLPLLQVLHVLDPREVAGNQPDVPLQVESSNNEYTELHSNGHHEGKYAREGGLISTISSVTSLEDEQGGAPTQDLSAFVQVMTRLTADPTHAYKRASV